MGKKCREIYRVKFSPRSWSVIDHIIMHVTSSNSRFYSGICSVGACNNVYILILKTTSHELLQPADVPSVPASSYNRYSYRNKLDIGRYDVQFMERHLQLQESRAKLSALI